MAGFVAAMLIFLQSLCSPAIAQDTALAGTGRNGSKGTQFVFSVSWQPGFCKTRPKRPECLDQTAERFDATHFSLHGLWPVRKSYCGVDAAMRDRDKKGEWNDLPKLAVGPSTAGRLLVAMPGSRSGLDRHQWLRSGTCQTANAEDYFALQLRFLDLLNASPVQALFAGRIRREVGAADVRQAFDAAFGAGAGGRVRMQCRKVGDLMVVTGLTVGLTGDLFQEKAFPDLIRAAGETEIGCSAGIVEKAGLP